MTCQTCKSERILSYNGKCSDLFSGSIGPKHKDFSDDGYGYVPEGLGIGGGDYLRGDLCLNCGQMQGKWPVPAHESESSENDETDEPMFPNIVVELSGHDGNAFAVMGAVTTALRKNNVSAAMIHEFRRQATSGDYNELLRTCTKWVMVV